MSKKSLIINKTYLISLVRKRPAIWDKTTEIYKCKRAKAAAWHEICLALNKDYEQIDQISRKEYFKHLIRTWTHIRDNWMKSMKDKRNEKVLVKPYIYHKQLLFLKKIIITNDENAFIAKIEDTDQQDDTTEEENEYENAGTSYFSMEIQEMIEDNYREKMTKKSLMISRPELIRLVRGRPELWDKTSDIYKNKRAKASAWRDICYVMNPFYEEINQKRRKEYFKLLISVWTQVRDTWIRSLKNKSSRPYKHHDQMLFLKKVITSTDIRDGIANTSENEQESIIDDEYECAELDLSSRNRQTMNEDVDGGENSSFVDTQSKNASSQTEMEDRNYSFFKSIEPTLAYFNDDQILEFQAGTINLLQKIKTDQIYNQFQQQSAPPIVSSQISEDASTSFNQDPIKIETFDIT